MWWSRHSPSLKFIPSTCCWLSLPPNSEARTLLKKTSLSNIWCLLEVPHDDRVQERHDVANQQPDQLGDLRVADVDEAEQHQCHHAEEPGDDDECDGGAGEVLVHLQ